MAYAILRFVGLHQIAQGNFENRPTYWAVDTLSLGALLLFPRLIFTTLSDNVFVLCVPI